MQQTSAPSGPTARQAERLDGDARRRGSTEIEQRQQRQQPARLTELDAPLAAQPEKRSDEDFLEERLSSHERPNGERHGDSTALENGQGGLAEGSPSTARDPDRGTLGPDGTFEMLTQIYMVAQLVFWSLWGTLARLGMQWLTFYPGAPIVIPNLWANFGGCLIMGFINEDQRLFSREWGSLKPHSSVAATKAGDADANLVESRRRAHNKAKKTLPLFVGLATGFCGSMTSFSTFMRDVFLALANDLPTPVDHPFAAPVTAASTVARNNGYSVNAVLAIITITVALSLAGLIIGAHLALASEGFMPSLPFSCFRTFVEPVVALLGLGCWLGAVFLAIWPPDRPDGPSSRGSWSNETWRGEAIFALVFAPLGCLLRFWLSLRLNARIASFPLGTLSANLVACAVLGMSYDLQHVPLGASRLVGGGLVGCQVLQGVEDGFCGCLSTVSTWVLELRTLRRRHAWRYGSASVLLGLGLLVAIMGGVRWSKGFVPAACVVSNVQ